MKRQLFAGLLCTILLVPVIGRTQPRPVADYPLDEETEKTIRLFDISGNGKHGTLVKKSDKPTDEILAGSLLFPENTNTWCINKKLPEEATVRIPSLFPSTTKTITLTFWYFAELKDTNASNPSLQNMITFPTYIVSVLKDVKNPARLQVSFPKLGGAPASIELADGWNMITISIGQQSVQFAAKPYKSNDPLKGVTTEIKNPAKKSIDFSGEGKIYSTAFTGKIWHLRFYDHLLDNQDIADNFQEALLMALPASVISQPETKLDYFHGSAMRYLKFSSEGKPVTSGQNAIRTISVLSPGTKFVSDRYGKKDAIVSGDAGFPINDPEILKTLQTNFDSLSGYTISFWTQLDGPVDPLKETEVFPYRPEDFRYQFFYFADDKGNTLGGLERIKDRLVINRYLPRISPLRTWELWLWNPVCFQVQGWYHVVLSQKDNATRVYLFPPGDKADGPEQQKYGSLNYFGMQDLSRVKKIGLGKPPGSKPNVQSSGAISDFAIYNWPFSEAEAKAVHKLERN